MEPQCPLRLQMEIVPILLVTNAIREADALIEGSLFCGGSLPLFEIRSKIHIFLTGSHILKFIDFVKLVSQLL